MILYSYDYNLVQVRVLYVNVLVELFKHLTDRGSQDVHHTFLIKFIFQSRPFLKQKC